MSCTHCKTESSKEHNYCSYCGQHLSNHSSIPAMCGHRRYHESHNPDAHFCVKCGQDMNNEHGLEDAAMAPMI